MSHLPFPLPCSLMSTCAFQVDGTRVFDEKKEESTKILIETQGKIAKSETLLSFIEDRLKKLEEEKEDLKEYQNWDKMKR